MSLFYNLTVTGYAIVSSVGPAPAAGEQAAAILRPQLNGDIVDFSDHDHDPRNTNLILLFQNKVYAISVTEILDISILFSFPRHFAPFQTLWKYVTLGIKELIW